MMERPSLRVLTPRETPRHADDYVSVANLPGRTEVICYEDIPDHKELEPGLYVFTGPEPARPQHRRALRRPVRPAARWDRPSSP